MGVCTGDRADVCRAVYGAIYINYRAFLVYQCCVLVELSSSVLSFKQSFKQIFELKGETPLDPPCALRALFTAWAELLQRLWQSVQQSFCRALYGGLCRAFIELLQSFCRAFAELRQSFGRASCRALCRALCRASIEPRVGVQSVDVCMGD